MVHAPAATLHGAPGGAGSSSSSSGGLFSGGAPVLFKFQGAWYIMAAQQPGWSGGSLLLWVAEGPSPCTSQWTLLPPPVSTAHHTSAAGGFDASAGKASSSSRGVHRSFTAAWQLQKPVTALSSRPAFVHLHHFGDGSQLLIYYGDKWNVDGAGDVGNASYVWLPLVHAGEAGSKALELKLLDSWRVGDYRSTSSEGSNAPVAAV